MRTLQAIIIAAALSLAAGALANPSLPDAAVVREAFDGKEGTLVVMDCATGETFASDPVLANKAFAPCSTFKIWNTLIGLEEGILKNPDGPFWKWDGEKRFIPEWNRNLTLREAFKASCVPAFQALARQIGEARMQAWLDKLDYGDRNMGGRPDSFWLPRTGQPGILITPGQQAALLAKLVNHKLPVKKEPVATLLDIMRIASTERGTLYGKTGTGLRDGMEIPSGSGDFNMGWLTGVLDNGGSKFAYACLVLGPGLGGKDARTIVEKVFHDGGML